jgi:hypothetical protein
MLIDKPLTCFIITEEVVFNQYLQEIASKWSVERMQIGGLTCYKSVVGQGQSDGVVFILNIYPNIVGVENTRLYFEVGSDWLSKYILIVMMDTTYDNGKIVIFRKENYFLLLFLIMLFQRHYKFTK